MNIWGLNSLWQMLDKGNFGSYEKKEQKAKDAINCAGLNERERIVVWLRCGLLDGRCHSLDSIAEMFELNRERIRQAEASAMKKMKAVYQREDSK